MEVVVTIGTTRHCSFTIAGPATWNSLPASLRDDQLSATAFRHLLKTELFSRAYDSSLARWC